jgi:cytochrome c biogenesis protein CcdA
MSDFTCKLDSLTSRTLEPTFWVIAGAAIVDSINPCAIAVLLILLTALIAQNDKKKVLKLGFVFILSIFIAYFLLGIGLLGVVNVTHLAGPFHRIIGFLAIIIGIFNIKDFFRYGAGGFVMEIPRSWRPKLKALLNSVTSAPAIFAIGFLVTLFELPCTGGPYLFVLGLLSQNIDWVRIVPILILYNLVFVLPLIIITFLIYLGYSSTEKADKWKEKNIRVLHLIAGIIMVLLGLWVFFG